VTVEDCASKHFDASVRRRLDPEWHRLRPSAKALVNDLKTLRILFQSLARYDAVQFWRFLQGLRSQSAGSRYPSMWLLSPAANVLFRRARERLYVVGRPGAAGATTEGATAKKARTALLVPVLEENPKWALLRRILGEVRGLWAKKLRKSTSPDPSLLYEGGARVLVMVADDRTLDVVRQYLSEGAERTMTLRWLRYLEAFNERSRAISRGQGGVNVLTEEARLLLEEEGRARNLLFGTGSAESGRSSGVFRRKRDEIFAGLMRKRRRVNEERGRGDSGIGGDVGLGEVLDGAITSVEQDGSDPFRATFVGRNADRTRLEEDDINVFKAERLDDMRVVIRTYSSLEGEDAFDMLEDVRPAFVILYDAQLAFVRALEIYASMSFDDEERPPAKSDHDRLRVMTMLFENSSETTNYYKTIEREKNAFDNLIRHQKNMPVLRPVTVETQEMQLSSPASSYADGTLPLGLDTRRGRGKRGGAGDIRKEIIVDVREFRSALPSVLHQQGLLLAPATLTVGDFVISPAHCIERKSVGDLFGSFASGRLYTQAEAMSKHYTCPCLLIEFDPDKSFSLSSPHDINGEIRKDAISSKLSLLVLHFPRLRILWSRGPHSTVKIFKKLKEKHEEPNFDKAVEIGSNESLDALLGAGEGDGEGDEINEAARDMLLRFPGVTISSARKIMSACDSITELMQMSREDLKKIVGPVTGQKLFTFFRQKLA